MTKAETISAAKAARRVVNYRRRYQGAIVVQQAAIAYRTLRQEAGDAK